MSRRFLLTFAILLGCAREMPAAPQEGLFFALNDAIEQDRRAPKSTYTIRYVDLTNFTDAEVLQMHYRMLKLQFNMLSRRKNFGDTRMVDFTDAFGHPVNGVNRKPIPSRVLAVNLYDFGIPPEVWERLVEREPFYHQRKAKKVQVPVNGTDQYGRPYVVRYDEKEEIVHDIPDELPRESVDRLYALTNSKVPIVRGDWFLFITSIEADRGSQKDGKFVGGGFGYYDFLGIKSRDDFFKLTGVDLKDYRTIEGMLVAIVLKKYTGVAQNDRAIIRVPARKGFVWYTMDFFDVNLNTPNRIPMVVLNPNRMEHQAERHFGTLVNGLPVTLACDAKGVLQLYAPPEVGPDSTATGNDKRIHPNKSCISCHDTGFLRGINDEVRKIYRVRPNQIYNVLNAPDYNKDERKLLEDILLPDFNWQLKRDQEDYDHAVEECIGIKARQAAKEYREVYEMYDLVDIDTATIARDINVDVNILTARFLAYRKTDPLTTHAVAGLSTGQTIPRATYELTFHLFQQIGRGVPLK